MVEAELLINTLTLLVTLVVLVFVGIAYVRTRIQRLLVLFLLAGLLGVNMVVSIAEDVLEGSIPYVELLSSLFGLGLALLLLATVLRQFSWDPR
jgi:hypothetical protein